MRIMINLIILSFITISAFTVIYVKHKNRLINIDIENLEKKLSNELNEHKKLLDIKDKRNKSSHYFFASLAAESLIREIDRMISYRSINSIKFIVYPNNSGVDVFLGEDIEDLSGRFGWIWRELSNV